jgi:tetratricopeptide (TPR) repeat protein
MSPDDTHPAARPQPDPAALTALQSLYDAGRYLDAWQAAQAFAPVGEWADTPALILGGRLAMQWGNTPLSNRLHLRAHRQSPNDDSAFYYFILSIHAKHGPFEALRLIHERTATFSGPPVTQAQADLWIQQARLLSLFRDFDAAGSCLALAENTFPHYPWLWVEKSGHLREQDRYEESLAAALHAIRLRPWYRPAIQAQVHLLQLLGRDDEALALLEASSQHLQCAGLVQSHALALEEIGRDIDLLATLERLGKLQPLATPDHLRWRAARRCDACYRLGRDAEALATAREAGPGFYEKIAERLATPPAPDARRVKLPLGFVRQHHMTCAPATMAALSHFWEQPIDHLELAREICYDGTPAHLERAWAEEHGWVVREFRVTWESARALLDRGCPFALVTVGIRSGHMQAVLGYDSRLGVLLIRDPYQRSFSEWIADSLFETHASNGPRGMIMIPRDKASLLDGIELPDEALHKHAHALQRALARHDRATAGAAVSALELANTDHLLTHKARFEIAYYDANPALALPPVRVLRERFPKDVNLQLDELQLLNQLGRTTEHRELLASLAGRPYAPLVFQRQEAEELTRDARHHPRALKLLRRALRRHASDASTLIALAHLLWNMSRLPEATHLYRLAASAGDKNEGHWDSYFKASRHLRKTDESLTLIRCRFELWGDRSSQPARTLFDCFEALDRMPEAFATLDEARRKRPGDGDLLLFCADAHARYGRYSDADELMQAAAPRASSSAWRRTAAKIAGIQGEHVLALGHWREIVALNPSDSFAHGAVARTLAIIEGRDSALRHLDEACVQQPHSLALRQTQIEWLRDEDPERRVASIDALLTLDPANAWAHREKARALRRQQRLAEALASAEDALRIDPSSPSSHGIRAEMLAALDRLSDARESYRAGIRLSIDAHWLFSELLSACPDFASRREAVVFIQEELLRQPSLDAAPLQFRATARPILSPEDLRAALELLWQRHPESWSVWSALINHLLDQELAPEALAKATNAVLRFPLTPRLWLDLGNVQAHLGETECARAAYEKALSINPAWSLVSRQLSRIHERTLQLDLAAHVLRRAVALEPNSGLNHGWLADILWRQRDTDAALTSLEKAIAITPDYDWAWDRLREWSPSAGQPDRALRLAETLAQTRPGEVDSWTRLVRLRFNDHSPDANLQALDRAAALDPRNPDIYDLRADLLAFHKRYDEALAACSPGVFGDAPPVSLQGRAAWIEHCRGRIHQAIKRMNAVVAAHPDYVWGWSLLANWYYNENQFDDLQKAAARWAWLSPDTALPHGYLGIVHKERSRRKEAKDAFTRAIAADPAYEYGAFELLGLQLGDSEFEAVAKTLQHIETHFPPAESLRAQLQFARARKDRDAAHKHLRTLGCLSSLSPSELNFSTNIALKNDWEKEVASAFGPLLSDADTLPELGRQWARAREKKSFLLTLWALRKLRPTPAHRRNIDMALIEQLGDARRVRMLQLFCLLRRSELRAHEDTWGQVGYAFNTNHRYRSVVRWMRDWRKRPEAPPWMRVNLIQSLYSRKKITEARDALMAALDRPRDHTHDMLLVWLACEQALDGNTVGALSTRDRITENKLSDYDKALLALTECMISVQQAESGSKTTAFKEAREKLRHKVLEFPAICSAPALKSFYRRTLRRLSKDGGSLWFRVRSYLPFFPENSTSSDIILSPSLIWIILIVLLGGFRGCAALLD